MNYWFLPILWGRWTMILMRLMRSYYSPYTSSHWIFGLVYSFMLRVVYHSQVVPLPKLSNRECVPSEMCPIWHHDARGKRPTNAQPNLTTSRQKKKGTRSGGTDYIPVSWNAVHTENLKHLSLIRHTQYGELQTSLRYLAVNQ
jgi:hypothetical protein